MDSIFDLFGQLVSPHHGMKGRPPYLPTEGDRNKIKMLLAQGKSISIMANALGISPATVKRHFRAELKVRDAMRDRLEAAFTMKLWELVQEGNAAAMRLWMTHMERNDRMEIERAMGSSPQGSGEARQERVGKKQLDERRAIDADADLMAELEQEATSQDAVH